MKDLTIRPLKLDDLEDLVGFCDKEIGKNYFNLESLRDSFYKSYKNGQTSSFIVYNPQNEIVGIRLTFAPGTWMIDFKKGLSPKEWKVEPEEIAYFKSLFINKNYQLQGLGPELSRRSLEVLKQQGAKAVLCHSAMQSPNNSSQKYLKGIGFIPLKEHLRFWEEIDYQCTHCQKRPCECTALEMILYL